MILQALASYYHRLASEAGSGLAQPGYSPEQISFVIILDKEGKVVQVDDIQDITGKKPRPRIMEVPQAEKRTFGIKPNFLWDKTGYVLGVSNTSKRSADELKAFVMHHQSLLQDESDEGLQALLKFLKGWKPEQCCPPLFPQEMIDKNVVFRLDGERQYLHDRPAARQLRAQMLAKAGGDGGEAAQAAAAPVMCLVSGRKAPPERLHPSIKGVGGAQPSGASIVSFNQASFTSYNKKQGANAPVSADSTFAYTTALNHLLRRDADNRQRLRVGDTTVVFWAEAGEAGAAAARASEQSFADLLGAGSADATDETEVERVRGILEHVRKGLPLSGINPALKDETRMYILGLSPNESRLSVRFWLTDTFGALLKNLRMHQTDLELAPAPWKTFPTPWRLVLATVPTREGVKPEMDDALNNQVGDLMRAMLSGAAYPRNLLGNALVRMRSDGHISGIRVALCKGVLTRERRLQQRNNSEEIPVSLDKSSTEPGYLLGRLFAVLENAQHAALGGSVNATIRDRYYGAASATPATIFPVLLRNSNNHLAKLRKERKGQAVNIEKLMQEILDKMPDHFPRSLNIEGQGRFAIGYYHQSKDHFTRRESGEGTDSAAQAEQDSNHGDQQ